MRENSGAMSCSRKIFLASAACGLALLSPLGADARTENLVWDQPGGNGVVTGYGIRFGTKPDGLTHVTNIDVEDAARGVDGSYRYVLQVPPFLESSDLYIAVQAFEQDANRKLVAISPPSNVIMRKGDPPPQDPPLPPPADDGGSSGDGGTPDTDGPLGTPGRPQLVLE